MKKKKLLSQLFAVLALNTVFFVQAQYTQSENYIVSKTYLKEDQSKKIETVQYFDGLGRPKQVVNVKASPSGKDVVTKIEYDGFGRQDKDHLPMPQQGSTSGAIYSSATTSYTESAGAPLYGSGPYYTQKDLEKSPLYRLLSTTSPGEWSTNSKKSEFFYETNGNEVKKYTATFDYATFSSRSGLDSFPYPANSLYKSRIKDEDGNETIEYKNGEGQTLLVRKVLSSTENADTYYVYNNYNQLAYVIPPLAVQAGNVSTTTLNNHCYQYKYDGRNRLVEKKLPGKDWEYMVYDKQDRLVMTQDANLGADKKWLFTKYDQFGRVAYTGIYDSMQDYGSAGRSFEQGEVNKKESNNVARTSSAGFTAPGLIVYYDNLAAKNYPNTFSTILSINYYDTYPPGSPAVPATILTQNVLPQNAQTSNISTKSLPTASFVKNIENNAWTKNFTWYDTKGRPIGSQSTNHLGGYTKTETQLDFAGMPQKTFTYHSRVNTTTPDVTIKERFVYNANNNALEKHYHEVVGKRPEELLSDNTYNEIGQLKTKKVGNNIQELNYSYNIRGWMTGINLDGNGNFQTGKLFNYKINYNTPLQGLANPNPDFSTAIKPRYNGNIAEVLWQKDGDTHINRYGYVYDKLNRLTAGLYQSDLTQTSKEHSERLTYDQNGNIITLKRSAYFMGTTAELIDNLTYNYTNTGNKVNAITDATQDSNGYEGGGATIAYDANGNMITMPDKGISSISYNFLNLPFDLQITPDSNTNTAISNLYRADGTKLRKKNTTSETGIHSTTTEIHTTDYLDGFVYLNSERSGEISIDSESKVAMEREAFSPESLAIVAPRGGGTSNAVLQFVPTAEGFYDFKENKYIYQYKDHLGNTRVSYAWNTTTNSIDVLDKNDYYPFGMNHLNSNAGSFVGQGSYKNYKYNGKELQETGMYDYGWRNYAPDIGRWITPDPLLQDLDFTFNPNDADEDDDDETEEATTRTLGVGGGIFNPNNLNPYAYGYNDPVRFDDPDGKCPICVIALIAVLVSEPLKNGTTNPQADRQAFKQAESFRNNQIAMIATGGSGSPNTGASVILNVAKSKAQNEVRKSILEQNAKNGAAFEKTVVKNLKDTGHKNVQQQVTIKPNQAGAKNVRVDATSVKKGKINLTEAKSSSTAPLTKNQKSGFPIIQNSGGTVMGKGKPGIPGGTQIPPTKVNVVRPKENQ